MRSFNTAGPVKPERHYCIPPLDRLDLENALDLIRDEQYFALRAPRQSGKTSTLLALRDLLNANAHTVASTPVSNAVNPQGKMSGRLLAQF